MVAVFATSYPAKRKIKRIIKKKSYTEKKNYKRKPKIKKRKHDDDPV